MAARIKIGDIIEIPIHEGYCYAQVTHKCPQNGYLIAVFKIKSKHKIKDFDVTSEVQFRIFYFINAALKSNLIQIVGNMPISEELKEFPVFKTSLPPELTGGKRAWRLWFGAKEGSSGVKKLSKKENNYPLLKIAGHEYLIKLIENNWTHDVDPVLLTSGKDSYDIIN